MEAFKTESYKLIQEVMLHLDILQGTQFSDCIDDVRLELTNGIEDLTMLVQNSHDLKVDARAIVGTHVVGGKKFRICHIATMVAGEGCRAIGAVGVSWGESIPYNMGMRVGTNTVNKKNAELWAIAVAAKTALTRGYRHILVSSQNFTFTRKLMQNLNEGKLDNTECHTLVIKIREYKNQGLDIMIPDEVDDAVVTSSGKRVAEKAKKLAKEAFQEAKRSQATM